MSSLSVLATWGVCRWGADCSDSWQLVGITHQHWAWPSKQAMVDAACWSANEKQLPNVDEWADVSPAMKVKKGQLKTLDLVQMDQLPTALRSQGHVFLDWLIYKVCDWYATQWLRLQDVCMPWVQISNKSSKNMTFSVILPIFVNINPKTGCNKMRLAKTYWTMLSCNIDLTQCLRVEGVYMPWIQILNKSLREHETWWKFYPVYWGLYSPPWVPADFTRFPV